MKFRHRRVGVQRERILVRVTATACKDGDILLAVHHVGRRIGHSGLELHGPELFARVRAQGLEDPVVGRGKNDPAGAIAAWQKLLAANPGFEARAKVEDLIAQAQATITKKP